MAKNKKQKKNKRKSNLNPLVKLQLSRELKKRDDLTPEAREKIMLAFEHLDMRTLLTDPDALAQAATNPAEELMNYLLDDDSVDVSDTDDSAATDDVSRETSDVDAVADVDAGSEDSKIG